MVKIHTNYGIITLTLDAEKAPITVANFLDYAKSGFYDGTIFHRVIKNFMVQGGGMETGMKEKATKDQIQNEADNGLSNDTGTVAMARTMVPHSASSQFFINCNDNHFLNHTGKNDQGWGYAVFGKVSDGMEVVKLIEAVTVGSNNGHADVPSEDVVIEKMEVLS